MKRRKKRKILLKFWRAFVMTLLLILLPTILLFGIAIAQGKTHIQGNEARQAIVIEENENSSSLKVFGNEIELPASFFQPFKSAAKSVLQYFPPEIRLFFSGLTKIFKEHE